MQKSPYDVLRRPIVSEKSMDGVADKTYTFEVARDANKLEIKRAVEEVFKVKVVSVNTINMTGKKKRMGVHQGRRSDYKKAIVKLTPDSKPLEFFEGMV